MIVRTWERKAGPATRKRLADLADALISLESDVVGLVVGRRVPHRELAHEPGEERAEGGIAVDPVDGDLDGCVEDVIRQLFGPRQHLGDEPDVVLDHAGEEVHAVHLSLGGNAERPGWMEMHVARRLEAERRRPAAPAGRRLPVGAAEGAGEGLVGGVAGVDRDRQHLVGRRDEPVGGPLEQDAPAERGGRLAGRRRDEPVEVEPREVHAGGQRLARRLVIVERGRENLEKPGKGVVRSAHARDRTSGHADDA